MQKPPLLQLEEGGELQKKYTVVMENLLVKICRVICLQRGDTTSSFTRANCCYYRTYELEQEAGLH